MTTLKQEASELSEAEVKENLAFLDSPIVKALGEIDQGPNFIEEFEAAVKEISIVFMSTRTVSIERADNPEDLTKIENEAREVFGQGFISEAQLKLIELKVKNKAEKFSNNEEESQDIVEGVVREI